MKAIKKLVFGLFLFTGILMQAQVNISVNVGTPPAWGPAGTAPDARYYYLPDIATYYDINTGQYIYLNNGQWVRAAALPPAYSNYNLYNGYKVVVNNYRDNTPYVYYNEHKVKYPKGYRGAPQKTIGTPPGQAKKMEAHNGNRGGGKPNGNSHGNGNGHGKH